MSKSPSAGLCVLSLANTGERFGYYTMLAIFLLYLQAKFDSTPQYQARSMPYFWRLSISCPL